jgi:hypothetical protein
MTNAFDKEILIGLNEDSVRRRKLRMKATSSVKTTSRIQVVSMTSIEKRCLIKNMRISTEALEMT